MSTADAGFLCDRASLIGDGDERKTCTYRLHVMCWHHVTDTARTSVFEGGLYADINVTAQRVGFRRNWRFIFVILIIVHKRGRWMRTHFVYCLQILCRTSQPCYWYFRTGKIPGLKLGSEAQCLEWRLWWFSSFTTVTRPNGRIQS